MRTPCLQRKRKYFFVAKRCIFQQSRIKQLVFRILCLIFWRIFYFWVSKFAIFDFLRLLITGFLGWYLDISYSHLVKGVNFDFSRWHRTKINVYLIFKEIFSSNFVFAIYSFLCPYAWIFQKMTFINLFQNYHLQKYYF